MLKLTPNMRIVCICRGGQVRSVAARYVLSDRFGFRKVLACGFEKNDEETVEMLCEWADAVLIVGSASQWIGSLLKTPPEKTIALNIGPDVYGRYNHPELVQMLTTKLRELIS